MGWKRWGNQSRSANEAEATGNQGGVPMKRRQWRVDAEAAMRWRGWGIEREVKGVRQCWRGRSRVRFRAVRGKRSVPLTWRFSLKNGDVFETKPPRHYLTWIGVRAPCEPGSSEWEPTQGTGPWSAQGEKWKNHAVKQIKRFAHSMKTVEIQAYVDQYFRIGSGFALGRRVSAFGLIRDGIQYFSK
jgi:hypothetical protein